MANSENTAINELIAQVTGGPLSRSLGSGSAGTSDSATSGSAATSSSAATSGPSGTSAIASPVPVAAASVPLPARAVAPLGAVDPRPMYTTIPLAMPVAAPFEAQRPVLPASYPVVPRAMLAEVAPAADEPDTHVGAPPFEMAVDPAAQPAWAPQMAGQVWSEGEHSVGTLRLRKPSHVRVVIGRLVVPIALLMLAGLAIGTYVAVDGTTSDLERAVAPPPAAPPPVVPALASPSEPIAAPVAEAPAQPATVPAPVAEAAASPATAREPVAQQPAATPTEPAATPTEPATTPTEPSAAPPTLVEIRIDSTPSGATVMLVDRGKSQFVGTTPVDAAVDPSREYDLVFTHENRPPHTAHFDPRTTRRVAVTLGRRTPAPRPAPRPEVEPRQAERAPVGEGTLMISSKPPCEIVIDGEPTGLMTPQRQITLPAGRHRITLINSENGIRKTITVQITAGSTEKVIEDLMQ